MHIRWEQLATILISLVLVAVGAWAIQDYLWETPMASAPLATMAPTPTPSPTPSPKPSSAPAVSPGTDEPTPTPSPTPVVAALGETSYVAEGVSIQMLSFRDTDSTVHVANITLTDMSLLRAGLAKGTFGSNFREKTSEMAEQYQAVLAISGDYYGANMDGVVVRNGTLYIDEPERQMAAIFIDGTMRIYEESEVDAGELLSQGLWQSYTFGPGLVIDGEIPESFPSGVRGKNPRCAIGMIEPGHFLFVTVDGRSSGNSGMSLPELAAFMKSRGCVQAYNLDGGGSATMWFGGSVYNQPSGGTQRDISDILYIPLDGSLIGPASED